MLSHNWRIKKRDGRILPFDIKKIATAIGQAGAAAGEFSTAQAVALSEQTLAPLEKIYADGLVPSVEMIQDIVEDILLHSVYKKSAKAYILYRDQHAKLRDFLKNSQINLVDQYLNRKDWQVKENSNMAYSLQGLNNYVSNNISQSYWLNKIYSDQISQAHQAGDLHIHDLGMLSVYCVGWDLHDLLREGFHGVRGKVASRPAKHFRTALGQIVNFFYTLQGEAAGAQAFSNFDTLLAPFIHYDHLSDAAIKQALQEFVFNINVPTRVGFQSPFTNVTLDLVPPKTLMNEPVIIGGKMQSKTYVEFQPEMDRFNRIFLGVLTEGDANGRVFTFPIPTYNLTTDFDWNNPNITSLWEVTAKYGIPYFANFVNSDMSADDARSMCCRLRIDNRELQKRGGGLFGANPLTGSIGIVTINLPRIGHLAKDKRDFLNQLKHLMQLAKTSLEVKRKVLEKLSNQGLYPYTKFYLRHMKKRYDCYWHNHFSTIGLVGMNEACLNFLGEHIGTHTGKAFAEEVLAFMRTELEAFQQETGHLYNLEATPAESTTFRLARLDAQKFNRDQLNFLPTVKNLPIYTNSSQLPVNFTDDVFEMLDLQDNLQTQYTGGTVLHLFLGEAAADAGAVKNFVKKVCHQYRLPYFSLTPTFSICQQHGYLNGIQTTCQHCQEKTEIYSRVVGYIRPLDQWNEGKQAEFELRKNFNIDEH
jgi:anaerobic ribonucleoside-triphosphate reductase